ncbi:hypothetical protein EDB19DRAFT_1918680 [Suillus lakei]|nr:hypothetical protein EDB19DRAFT_1918680 [Suillus lakei]
MDGFVPISLDAEDGIGDLPVSIFIFRGKNTPPEDGIYFINACVVTTSVDEDTTLELYCVDDMQSTDSGRALPTVIVIGKVSKGSSELVDTRGFDLNIMQYGIMPQQLARIHCFYPDDHPHLTKTPMPTAEKHVIVQGCITELYHKQCVVSVHDITLGPSTAVVEKCRHVDAIPPTKLKSFNWSGGKGKKSQCAAHTESEHNRWQHQLAMSLSPISSLSPSASPAGFDAAQHPQLQHVAPPWWVRLRQTPSFTHCSTYLEPLLSTLSCIATVN